MSYLTQHVHEPLDIQRFCDFTKLLFKRNKTDKVESPPDMFLEQ